MELDEPCYQARYGTYHRMGGHRAGIGPVSNIGQDRFEGSGKDVKTTLHLSSLRALKKDEIK